MSLRSFVASISRSWLTLDLVDLEGRRLEGRYHVPPPTAREALELFAIVEGIGAGIEAEKKAFARISTGWLGDELGNFLFSESFPFENASAKVLELLSLGYEERGVYEKELKDLDNKARETSWSSIVSDYRYTYKANDPLSESWPFFLSQFAEIPRLRARDQYTFIEAYAALKGSDNKAIKRIVDLAFPAVALSNKLEMPELTDDWINEQIEKARKLRNR